LTFDATSSTSILFGLSAEHAKSWRLGIHLQQTPNGLPARYYWIPRIPYITTTMGDFYSQFLSTMTGADNYLPTSPDELNPGFMPGAMRPMATPEIPPPYSSNSISEYFATYAEPAPVNPPKAGKGRRRSTANQGGGNPDQVKHRRTRSGCYTCRSRRVKVGQIAKLCRAISIM
jgi:hypothetical protein